MSTFFDDSRATGKKRGKWLTFYAGREVYGLALGQVKEVIGVTSMTKIPDSLDYFSGLINLRGVIIPVIDLRIRFQLENRDIVPKKTAIIIVEIDRHVYGMIVDEVGGVLSFLPEQLEMEVTTKNDFVKGIAKNDENKDLILLLNIENVLNLGYLKDVQDKGKEEGKEVKEVPESDLLQAA